MDRQPARSFEDLIVWHVAEGSLEEARYYLRLAHDLGYASSGELSQDAAEVGRLLGSYARALLSPSS